MSETTTIHAINTVLPAIVVLLPIIGALLAYTVGKVFKEKFSAYLASLTTVIVFLLTALQYQYISEGKVIEFTLTSSSTLFPIKFYLDSFGFLFAIITSFVWMLATIYSIKYMEKEHAANRFYFFLLLTLTANLGVVLGADLFSVYVFFELLAIFSLILVVHEETKKSMKAGKVYFYIGATGGLSLLLGIFIFFSQTGSLSYAPQLELLKELGNLRYLIAGLMIIGFGAKAGIFPVHIWLPKAHPVAPTPASALLSGIMVKAGIYGIFRTTGRLFTPTEVLEATEHVWALGDIGYWVIWIAIITGFLGWVLALLQDNMKRLLAYSTISQIGYIVLGIGSAAYLGYEGAYGYSGALYHVFNHAMFKTCLFLVAGAVYVRTRKLKMSKLGGLAKDMPYTTIIAIIAAAGIAGFPLFNGYISKTLIHHAIMEAYTHSHALSLHIAEILFVIIGGGTLAYYIKFIGFTFFGERKLEKEVKPAPKIMLIPMAILAGIIIFVGIFPETLLNSIVIPSLEMEAISHHQIEHLAHIHFFSLHNIVSVFMSIIAGIVIFIYAYHYNLLEKNWPEFLGVTFFYKKLASGFFWILEKPAVVVDNTLNNLFSRSPHNFADFCSRNIPERGVSETKTIHESRRENLSKQRETENLNQPLFYRDPIKFLQMFLTILINKIIKKVLTVFLYPYVLIKKIYVSLKHGPGKVDYTIKSEVKRIEKDKIRICPQMGTIGFALFLVAIMLAIYLIYELLTLLGYI